MNNVHIVSADTAAGARKASPSTSLTPFLSLLPSIICHSSPHLPFSQGGSAIGSPKVIKEMLDLAAKQDIKSWIIKRPLEDVNQVVQDQHNSKARYRYVLVNENNGGKL